MASLANVKFYEKADNGEERRVECRVSVDGEGTFHLTVPDDLEDSISGHIEPHSGVHMSRSRRPHLTLRVSGQNLKACKAAVHAGLRDWLACDVAEETVIRYGYRVKTSYWKMPDGVIFANGNDAKHSTDSDGPGEWHGTLDATTHAPGFAVELIAVVAKRTTHTRESGSVVTYERPGFKNHHAPESYGERLNSFVGLRTDADGYWHQSIELVDMPYTEPAAKFFYEMLIGMCAFSDKITDFFAEPETVRAAIEAGAVPLIGRDK